MDAPFVYVVKFWISPQGAAQILHWLDSKHTAEVVAQPGFPVGAPGAAGGETPPTAGTPT